MNVKSFALSLFGAYQMDELEQRDLRAIGN